VKYETYAKLNPLGMEEWGDIFEDGYVPIRDIVGNIAILEGTNKKKAVYLVAHEKMTADLLDKFIYKLSKRFKATKEEIKTEIIKNGLPLREELVSIVGTNMRFFT
jgi:hypothetical protein